MFLPPELYSGFTYYYYYYGDHIEWKRLESFSVAAEVEKINWLAYEHTLFLRGVV